MVTLLSGNSRILLTIDERGSWAELYYPYPGLHQHLLQARLGLFDEDRKTFTWCDDGSSDAEPPTEMQYIEHSNAASTRMTRLDAQLRVDDMVHPNRDLVIRRVTLHNPSDEKRHLRLFHYQSLNIGGSLYQDTAYWDDERKTVNHYKGRYYFQFLGHPEFDDITCGEHTLKGLRGTYVDAEDGRLEGNVISHGAADSVVQWNVPLGPNESRTIHLFVMLAGSRRLVNDLYDRVQGRDPGLFTKEAVAYCNHWVAARRGDIAEDLSDKARAVFRRSLFVMRDCQSVNGAVVASPDSRTLRSGGDTYNYCWWRDGAYIAKAMSDVGYHRGALAFLDFAAKCQEPEGYFLHRHFPNGTVGSTWHPPPFLQIDQTASVIDATWHYYKRSGNLDELLHMWHMVRTGADFLMRFVDERGLPRASFDLWEERKAVNAYSVAAVVQGLQAAERVALALGKRSGYWANAAARTQEAAIERFWNDEKGTVYKSLDPQDDTIDASVLLANFIPVDDPRFKTMVDTIERRLWVERTGGLARYEQDTYYGHENAWLICTLWLARARLATGDAERCRELIEWVADQAGRADLLPEQIDSETGLHTSVSPLVWSHSTFAETVVAYSDHRAKARAGQSEAVATTSVPPMGRAGAQR